MVSNIQSAISLLLDNYGSYAGLIAFIAAFFETLVGTGFLLPGSTILLVMGVFAGEGLIDIKVILLFAFLGAFLGDQSNYLIGKKYGVDLLKKPWLHISEDMLKKTQIFLDKKGSISIFFGRFLPAFKETLPFVAGSVKMKYISFVFWDILGAIGWSFEFVGVGYIFSNSLALAQTWLTRTVYLLAILIFISIVIYLLTRFTRKNLKNVKTSLKTAIDFILSRKIIKTFIKNHPKTTLFIKNRFLKNSFSGIPLTLLALSFVYILSLFGGIVEDFISKDPIIKFDHIFANIIPYLRTPIWTDFFTYITLFGKGEVVVAFFLLCVVLLWANGKKNYILPLFVSTFGAGIFIYITKLIFHRPRPKIAIYFEPTYSFPSGHATISVALYGFGIYLLFRLLKSDTLKFYISFFTIVFIALIGLSRIYLGEHYFSDVYSGYLLGSLWFIIGVAFTKWMDERGEKNVKPIKYTKYIAATAIVIFIYFFISFSQIFHYKKRYNMLKNEHVSISIKKIS